MPNGGLKAPQGMKRGASLPTPDSPNQGRFLARRNSDLSNDRKEQRRKQRQMDDAIWARILMEIPAFYPPPNLDNKHDDSDSSAVAMSRTPSASGPFADPDDDDIQIFVEGKANATMPQPEPDEPIDIFEPGSARVGSNDSSYIQDGEESEATGKGEEFDMSNVEMYEGPKDESSKAKFQPKKSIDVKVEAPQINLTDSSHFDLVLEPGGTTPAFKSPQTDDDDIEIVQPTGDYSDDESIEIVSSNHPNPNRDPSSLEDMDIIGDGRHHTTYASLTQVERVTSDQMHLDSRTPKDNAPQAFWNGQQRSSIEQICNLINIIDATIRDIFKLTPFCRAYLHWRVLLVRVRKRVTDHSYTPRGEDHKTNTFRRNALNEIELNLLHAKKTWEDLLSQLSSQMSAVKGFNNQLNLQLQVSLDDNSHPEKRLLATLENQIYKTLAAYVNTHDFQGDDDEEATTFWWRFFGVVEYEVGLKEFRAGLSLYLRHEYNQFIGTEENFEKMIKLTVDTGDGRNERGRADDMISKSEFREFMSRYGPLKDCFRNMQGVCVVKPVESDVKVALKTTVAKAPWFFPKNRNKAEHELKFGVNEKKWVLRLGWMEKGMAFVFSYMHRTNIKHTPVLHTYKESGKWVYEIETQHVKLDGETMRDLILNMCDKYKTEKVPIFGSSYEDVKREALKNKRQWQNCLQDEEKRRLNEQNKNAIAEGFEEVFELNGFFRVRLFKDEKSSSNLLESKEGSALLMWIRKKIKEIHLSCRNLWDDDAEARKNAAANMKYIIEKASSDRKNMIQVRYAKEDKVTIRHEEDKSYEPKHYLWALNDYRRKGETIMHELILSALKLISNSKSSIYNDETKLREAFDAIKTLITLCARIGVPLHIENEEGKTPIESVINWFNAKEKGPNLVAVQLFHDLFRTVYTYTSKDFKRTKTAPHGDVINIDHERRFASILGNVLRGVIPQGDIEIVEFLLKKDSNMAGMLQSFDIQKEESMFQDDGEVDRDGGEKLSGAASIRKTAETMTPLHYLIHETSKDNIETYFDAYANAPRIAHLIFSALTKEKSGLAARFCDTKAGQHSDTPILAAARMGHKPMMYFLLHKSCALRKEGIKRIDDERAVLTGARTMQQRLKAHPLAGSMISMPNLHASMHRPGSLGTMSDGPILTSDLEVARIGILPLPICEMVDSSGNCLLHFLVRSPAEQSVSVKQKYTTLRELTMILSLLDDAHEATNSMVDRSNEDNETPLSLLLSRHKELTKKAGVNRGGVQATEVANMALMLLARGARTTGLKADLMETLAEISGAAMNRCLNYRWSILMNAVKYGDERLVETLLNSKAIRTIPFLKHPRFDKRKDKQQRERALVLQARKRSAVASSKKREIDANDPFFGLSEHTLLHVATSSPYSSAKIVEILFRQDQVISDGKLRGVGKQLMITPEELKVGLLGHQHIDQNLRHELEMHQFRALHLIHQGTQSLQGEERNLLRIGLNLHDVLEKNPLHYIASRKNTQTKEIARLLLDHDVDIVAKDEKGMTPLHVAAEHNQLEIVDLMVNKHIHLNIKTGFDNDDRDAKEDGHRKMLIDEIETKKKSERTALFFAVEQGNWQICSLLLDKKASVDGYDSQGKTALTVAFQCHKSRIEDERLCREAFKLCKKTIGDLKGGALKIGSGLIIQNLEAKIKKWLDDFKRRNIKFDVQDPMCGICKALTTLKEAIQEMADPDPVEVDAKALNARLLPRPNKLHIKPEAEKPADPIDQIKRKLQEAEYAFTLELERVVPIKKNMKVTIDVLLNHGADIEQAFRLVTMGVSDCIDIDKEYEEIENKFESIEREVENAFQVENLQENMLKPITFHSTAMNRTPDGASKRKIHRNEEKELKAKSQRETKKDGSGKTPEKSMGLELFQQLKKRGEKETAKTERRDAIFREKYSQIVMNQKYKTTIRDARCGELWYYIVFLIMVTYLGIHTSSRNNKAVFLFRQGALETLVFDEFPFNTSRLLRRFDDIDSRDEFFQWARGPFLDVVYPGDPQIFWKGNELRLREPSYLGQGRMIGVPRWRQQRWKQVNCELRNEGQRGGDYSHLGGICIEERSSWLWIPSDRPKSGTSSFGILPDNANESYTFHELDSDRTFNYHWASGTARWYSGDGFVQNFPPVAYENVSVNPEVALERARTFRTETRASASVLIDALEANEWIDSLTRAVFVEFNVYNANEDLFMIARLNVEFPNTGGVFPSWNLEVLTEISGVFKYKNGLPLWILRAILTSLQLWHFIIWIADRILDMSRGSEEQGGSKYIESFYSYVELFISIFFLLVVVFYLFLLAEVQSLDFSDRTGYVDMGQARFLNEMYYNFFSFLLFLFWVKLTDLLAVQREVSRLVVMITVLLRKLVYLLFFMLIMWIAFSVGVYVSYGYRNEGSALWLTSLVTIIAQSFDSIDPGDDRDKSPFMATIYGILALIFILLVLLNLVIAILTTAYEHAREEVGDAYWARHQYRLVQHYLRVMKAEEDKKEKKDNKGRKPVSKEPAPISAAVKRYKFKCHESLYRNLKGAYQSTYGYTGTYAERLCCPLKMKSNVRSDDSDDEEEIHGDDKA